MFRTRRSKIIGLAVAVGFLVLASLGELFLYNQSDKMAQVGKTYQPNQIPASTASHTSYTDAKYPFTVSYPSDWKVNTKEYKGEEDVFFSYQVDSASPDQHAVDITCLNNTGHLSAQQWNEQFPDLMVHPLSCVR